MTNLATQNQSIFDQIIDEYLFSNNTNLTDQQKSLFKNIAKSFGLNPFKREIYATTFKGNMSVITGYQVYIDRATSSWYLDWREINTDYKDDVLIWATITIYRNDMKHPIKWSASLKEFIGKKGENEINYMRSKMPEFMIKKVVIWQWFRLAFPNELWGMPYLSEEITHNTENIPEVIKKDFTSERIPKFIEYIKSWEKNLADAMEYLKSSYNISEEVENELLEAIKTHILDDINNLADDTTTIPETTETAQEDVSTTD